MTIEPTKPTDLTNINNWFALAKNAMWIFCLVAVASMKLNSIDNVNESQNGKIERIEQDNKVLKATIAGIQDKQVDQLVMLTKLVAIAENERNNSPRK